MKKLLYVVVFLASLLLGLSFFYKNQQSVSLEYYMGWSAELPLTALLLVTLAIGVLSGYIASLLKSLKLRRNLSKANKTIRQLESAQI